MDNNGHFANVGYNVYRNGEKINSEVLTSPEYETTFTDGDEFYVAPVYDIAGRKVSPSTRGLHIKRGKSKWLTKCGRHACNY